MALSPRGSPNCIRRSAGVHTRPACGRLLVAAWALAVVACHSPTAPTALPTAITAQRTFQPPRSVSVLPTREALSVTGTVTVNEPCYNFTATTLLLADTLQVTVHAQRRRNVPCQQVLAAFDYEASVKSVPSAAYTLRLIYDRVGPPTFTEVAFQNGVVIP